jgi:hypothetical protein
LPVYRGFAAECNPADFLYEDIKFSQDIAIQWIWSQSQNQSSANNQSSGGGFGYGGFSINGQQANSVTNNLSKALNINFSGSEKKGTL